jgi:hypothetical protein
MLTGRATISRPSAFAFGFMLLTAVVGAQASPVTYSFATTSSPESFCKDSTGTFSTSECAAPIYDASISLSGSFLYDFGVALTSTLADGRARYVGSLSNLSGSAGGDAFQASSGVTIVGNEFVGGADDLLSLVASGDDLVGFTIGSRELIGVVLVWQEGSNFGFATPDFLADQTLPTSLPAFEGRVQLNFADVSDPTVMTAFVVFPGLLVQAQAVPEPMSLTLLGLGGLVLGIRRRHLPRRCPRP